MIMVDKLAYWSGLRYKSPMLKSSFSVGTLLICVAARSFVLSIIILGVMAGLTVLSSKTPFLRYIKLMLVPATFILLSTIVIAVNITEVPMGLLSIGLYGKYLSVTSSSLMEAGRLIIVALASISCLYFLTLTTPMPDILYVLQRLRCPKIVVELMMLIYRYIFVTLDMSSAILTSQKCRLGNKDFKTELSSIGQMLAVLLIRSLNRSAQIFDAMESRCYDGDIHVLCEHHPAERKEILGVTSFLIVMLVVTTLIKVYYPLL